MGVQRIMKFTNLFFLSLLVVLVGCSTVPSPIPRTTGPAVVVVRDSGFHGSSCTFDILVDGEMVGKVNGGETVIKVVSNGKHRVGIESSTAICTNVKMSKVVVVTGEPVIFRIGMTSTSQIIFDQLE